MFDANNAMRWERSFSASPLNPKSGSLFAMSPFLFVLKFPFPLS
jgi:hypothetical protein